MMTLIAAAALAAQPAPANPHGQMPMDSQKHQAMKAKCCCDDMAKGEHGQHASSDASHDAHGE